MVWTCRKCTFDNEDQTLACGACGAERSRPALPQEELRQRRADGDRPPPVAPAPPPQPGTGPPRRQRSAAGGPSSKAADLCQSGPFALAATLLLAFLVFGLPFLISDFRNNDADGVDPSTLPLPEPSAKTTEYRTYDGYNNNPSHPDWGASETSMLRRAVPTYSDGVYLATARPATANPRDISEATMKGATGKGSFNNVTALCVFFGQQVVEEMMDVQRPGCPIEYLTVGLRPDDPEYGERTLSRPSSSGRGPDKTKTVAAARGMPVTRSRYNQRTGRGVNQPRQQLNEASSLLDGGLFYSNFKAWSDALRTFEGGELIATDTWPPAGASYARADGQAWDPSNHTSHSFPALNTIKLPFANPPPPTNHFLKPVSRFWRFGNPRGNENPMLQAMGVIWFREHNFQARRIRAAHPDYDDEELYEEARKWVVALHQHVTVNEFYPAFARDTLPAYHGYDPEVHPGMSHLFQTSAMRFGHTMVPPGVYRRSRPRPAPGGGGRVCEFYETNSQTGAEEGRPAVRVCNTYWNGQDFLQEFEDDVEPWFMGMASQIAEQEDNEVTEDLRGFVFGSLDFSRRDLMAINIQRGRDHGIPGYLDALRSFENATVPATFEELHPNATVVAELRRLYGDDLEQVDAFVGGLLASGADGPGELFKLVMRDQFKRVRDGDRFWYADLKNGLFTADEVADIERTKFSNIIIRNTDLGEGDIQENVFEWRPDEDARAVCEQPAQLSAEMLEECTPMQTYDYWTGSEAVMWASLASLVFFTVVCVVWLYGVATKDTAKARAEHQLRNIAAESAVTFLPPHPERPDRHVRAVESARLNADRTAVYARISDDGGVMLLERPGPGMPLHWPLPLREIRSVYRHSAAEWRRRDARGRDVRDGGRTAVDYMIDVRGGAAQPSLYLSVHPDDDAAFLGSVLTNATEVLPVGPDAWAQLLGAYASEGRTRAVRQRRVEAFFREAYAVAARYRNGDGGGAAAAARGGDERAQREERARESERLAGLVEDVARNAAAGSEERLVRDMEVNYAEFSGALGGNSGAGDDNEYVRRLFEAARTCPLIPGAGGLTIDDGDVVRVEPGSTVSFAAFASFVVEYTNSRSHIAIGALGRVFSMELSPPPRGSDQPGAAADDAGARSKACPVPDQPGAAADDAGARSKACPVLVSDLRRVLGAMLQSGGQSLDGDSLRRVVERLLRRANLSGTRTKALSREQLGECLNLDAAAEEKAPDIDRGPDGGASGVYDSHLGGGAARYYLTLWRERRGAVWILTAFYLVEVYLFASRFYDYGWLRENSGLRRTLGYGVSFTRAAASEMMWALAVLLLTVSRNVITRLRDSPLGRAIPFDRAQAFHAHVAWNFLFWTLVHIVGHTFNFYNITTQPASDLTCTFRNVYHSTDEVPHLDYWLFRTVTGLTGYLLVPVTFALFVFAVDWPRHLGGAWCVRTPYRLFLKVHRLLYASLYLLTLLHGSFALIQKPDFPYFLVFPLAVFLFDKFVTQTRVAAAVTVHASELEGEVVRLQIERPQEFPLTSGQYCKIQVPSIDSSFHSFTVTSAPSDKLWVTLHVRVVGRWTTRLAQLVRQLRAQSQAVPRTLRARLDGPYGEGHQRWAEYENAVLVGGGIGVTPFASILLDLRDRLLDGSLLGRSPVRRVIFVWVMRDIRQWRWLEEIVRATAQLDGRLALEQGRAPVFYSYTFVTRPQSAQIGAAGVPDFNQLRFHMASRVDSLLSRRHGAVLQRHERRPNLANLMRNVRDDILAGGPLAKERELRSPGDPLVTGVFTCGPNRLGDGVNDACEEVSRESDGFYYAHFRQSF